MIGGVYCGETRKKKTLKNIYTSLIREFIIEDRQDF